MTNRTQTRQISMQHGRAEVSSINEKARTFEVMFSTGAKVLRSSWYDGQFYEELSMDPKSVRMGRLQSGTAPFLLNHNGYDVAATPGVIESARIEGGKGYATIRMAAEGIDPNADMYFKKVVDKIVRNVSVGYRTFKVEKTEGVDTKIPTLRAIDWEPNEISGVAMGAEQGAGIRADVPTNEVEIINRSINPKEEHRMDPEQLKAQEEAKRALEAKASEQRALEVEAEVQRRLTVAREREAGIKHACRTLGADGEKRAAEFLKNDKLTLADVRTAVLDELAKRSEDTAIQSAQGSGLERGEDDRDKWVRGATAGILSRTGQLSTIATVLAAHSQKDQRSQNDDLVAAFKGFDPKDNGGEFRAMSMLRLASESLERRGIKTRGLTDEKLLQRAIDATRDGGGANSSSDFSVALENAMYKTLLGEYAQQADTWRRFAGVDSVTDFRDSNRYRLGSFGVLDDLGEGGEYKQKQIPDAVKQVINTSTKGNKIALTRKALINDDMGAVLASAQRFGRMAGLSIEKAVYDLLALNGGLGPTITYNNITAPLFDAQFANIGTAGAISVDTLYADMVTMASQVDISNNEKLDIRPNSLLIPLTLGGLAKTINRAAYDPTAGSAFEAPNKVAGMYRDIIDTPRLAGTRRYSFSDQTPALLVVFLNGSQVPLMEQRPGWDIDGIEWKIRLDFKAQGFDPKGAVTNAGA